jgi:hypothetical protein
MECPCWRSVNKGADIPHRLRGIPTRVQNLYRVLDQDSVEGGSPASRALVRKLNTAIQAL